MTSVAAVAGRGIQSVFSPAGSHAESIGRLYNVFLAVAVIVYILVMLFLVLALLKRRTQTDSKYPRGATLSVVIATALSALTLFGLLTASVFTGRDIAGVPPDAIHLTITGRQWWWQADYEYADVSKRFATANEIVIPTGVPVAMKLRSPDVIHSLWIPNLHGKQDLIPGHDGDLVIKAERAGVYRGECAEFCGLQHAKMALWVNAVSPEEYAKWVRSQRQPSRIPSTAEQRKGQEIFMSSPCPLCHTIRGTEAAGKTAPELTHFASRRSIAAGTLPNRRGFLAGWILDPQHIKPGSYMPPVQLQSGQLDPLLTYLESLQ